MLRIAGRTMKARLSPAAILRDARLWRAPQDEELTPPSLRAQRSNPDCRRGGILDCFVASAQNCPAILSRAPRNDAVERAALNPIPLILRACDSIRLLRFWPPSP